MFINLKNRSLEKELLDNDEIPTTDLYVNLKELNTINTLLGGHFATIKGFESFKFNQEKTYTIIDIGCGGGDNLIAVAKWARKNQLKFKLIGIDLKPDCINYARKKCTEYKEISFIENDYRNLPEMGLSFDIALACLFTHHLTDQEINDLFNWCKKNSKLGLIINDLHRNHVAFYSIALLTFFFSKSYLVKNDAKLSVARGFVKQDWKKIFEQTNLNKEEVFVKWVWAFRWLVVLKKE